MIPAIMIAPTHCSDEFSIEFPSEQWFWKLPKEPTNSCSHSVNTAALQTGILWIWGWKSSKNRDILCQQYFVHFWINHPIPVPH